MANMLDYLSAYQNVTFSQMPFTEVDNLILCQLAYGRMENAAPQMPVRAQDAFIQLKNGFTGANRDLLALFCSSTRFKNTVITDYVSLLEAEYTLQFSAVTFLLPDETAFIAFRGTDNTLIGWKEDFNLSFISPVPAQEQAVMYLNRIAKNHNLPIRAGGHSKGGNLAVYAAAFCLPSAKDRITDVYNNDGPGQDEETIRMPIYKAVENRLHTYLPKSSVVGLLMAHETDYVIVDSSARGLRQHDPYSWLVEGNRFVRASATTPFSNFVSATIRDWLKGMNNAHRKRVIDILFDLLEASDAETLKEIRTSRARMALILFKAADLPDADKKLLFKTALSFISASQSNIGKLGPDTRIGPNELISYIKERIDSKSDQIPKEE